MKRSLMQIYVRGSDRAVALYRRAFDAVLVCSYPNDDGTLMHSELDIQGQILAVSERNAQNATICDETITGNTMQFCLQFGAGHEAMVQKAYDVLKADARVLYPLAPCEYSSLMTDLIDPYGIRWCLFV